MSSNYTEDSIKVLSDIESIRTRPGMYIGETTDPSTLFNEAIDNASDEALSGYATKILVEVDTENLIYRVTDNGRGVPHGRKLLNDKELPTMQVLCTKSFSGGKFNTEAYSRAGGLHGIGEVCLNALSDHHKWSSTRDNEIATVVTSKGEVISYEEVPTKNKNTGTTVEFHADPEIFESVEIPIEHIKLRCKENNAFGFDTDLYIDGEEQSDIKAKSIIDIIPDEKSDISTYTEMQFSGKVDEQLYQVGLRYTSDSHYYCYPYANLTYNYNQGTHSRLLWNAICDVWSEFYYEADEDLKYDDCTLGLRSVIHVEIQEKAFSAQIKDKLTVKSSVLEPLINDFKDQFRKFLKNNNDLRTALLARFSEYRASKNKLSARKEIMSLVKVSRKTKSSNKVHRKAPVKGLIECTSNEFLKSELYLLEGESAAGPLYRSRDPRYQAILPLRGKIKNVTYMDPKDALKSPDVLKVVNAVGTNILDDCDPSRCRYEKIILLSDSDFDGFGIRNLFFNVFVQLMPALVKAGMIYVVEAPLFSYIDPTTKIKKYTQDFDEIPIELKKTKSFSRYKGLGEMDDDEFQTTCLTKENRVIYRLTYPDDIDKFNRIMGTSEGKRELLEGENVLQYRKVNS